MTLVTPNTSWAAEGSPAIVSSQGAIAAPARRADSLAFLDIPSSRFVQWTSGTRVKIHAAVPLCVHHYLEGEHVHALRSRERGCFLVAQTLWAEKGSLTRPPRRSP